MDPERWERVQSLFHAALPLGDGERRSFLEAECGGDTDLVERVLGMLAEDKNEAPLLDRSLTGLARGLLGGTGPAPKTVGAYRIVGVLGEGGMGIVYLGERADLGSRVAIKMLRDAQLSPARRDRFASEQRTLARLNHPSIATLFDADALPDGTPYFVMEYVEGRPLTEHCAAVGASLSERLRLFREVCVAVRHAHAQAVIHRDLKPSNILVTGDGDVKLLDFGIARQLESVDTPADPTRTGLRMMTPSYAAPEQLLGEPPGVYTDVYALGVVLYELLTGRLPHDLSGLTPGQVERKVLDETAQPPSRAVRPSPDVGVGIAAPGGGGPGRAAWADLDVLCLGAMHRDPERRYRTVDGLIRDLDHFFAGEPLEARSDSFAYRARKFVGRNRRAVGASALVATTILALVGFYTARLAEERTHAQAEAAKATAVSEYIIGLFEAADPFTDGADDLDLPALLARGIERADRLDAQPDVQAQMFEVLGRVFTALSDYDEARVALDRSVALRRAGAGGPIDLASALGHLGNLERYSGRFDEAAALLREALALREQYLPPDHPDLPSTVDNLGIVLSNAGHFDEAQALLERGLAMRRELSPEPDILLAHSLNNLAVMLGQRGEYAAAEEYLRESLEIAEAILGPDHPTLAPDLANLGVMLEAQGAYAAADSALTRALEITRARLGDMHYETAFRLQQMGGVLRRAGEPDRAEARLREALEIESAILPPDHRNTGVTRVHLAGALQDQGRLHEAEPILREGLTILEASVGERHALTGMTRCHLGELVFGLGDPDQAESHFRDCLDVVEQVLPEDHDVLAGLRSKFGALLTSRERFAEAEPLLVDAYERLDERFGPEHRDTRDAARRLIHFYEATDRAGDAARVRASLEGSQNR